MAYPAKLLAPGETIQFEMRPHWRVLFLPVIALLAIVFGGGYLVGKMGVWFSGSLGDILRVVLIVALVGLFAWLVAMPVVRWFTEQYVFTNRRVITRSGVVRRRGRDVPLDKINNVSFEYSLLERIFQAGTLTIESAADSGALNIRNVPEVEVVQRRVYELVETNRAAGQAPASAQPPVAPPTQPTQVIDPNQGS